jgi:hypothetical protein
MGGARDEDIRKRYAVSQDVLAKIKSALTLKGLYASEEPPRRQADAPAKKRHIDAKQFLSSFQEKSDDFYLMRAYSLKPKHLKRIYEALIQRGLLSEYEYHCRSVKAPELEEPSENRDTASTLVCLLEDVSEATRLLYAPKNCVAASTSSPDSHQPAGRLQTNRFPHGPSRDSGRQHDLSLGEGAHCPQCGKTKVPFSPESCVYCGVVFCKMSPKTRYPGVAIWEPDFYER